MSRAKAILSSIHLLPSVSYPTPLYLATRKATPLPTLEWELTSALWSQVIDGTMEIAAARAARKPRGRRADCGEPGKGAICK